MLLFRVNRLPDVPAALNAETVVVVLAGKIIDEAAVTVDVMSAKVFAPVTVSAPTPP
jgi:hypothetical protein